MTSTRGASAASFPGSMFLMHLSSSPILLELLTNRVNRLRCPITKLKAK